LFPKYIFVKIKQQWASLTGTYGVSGLVMEGKSPKKVPQLVIDKVKEREDNMGFVVLESKDEVKEGSSVKIKDGPLKDYIGIYQGMSPDERAVVLFKLLGSDRLVKLNPKLLVVA
jgi:transcription antitermination factor NusG